MDLQNNRWSINQFTPLMIAALEGHKEAVKLLLREGARLDICDKDDQSVLFHAANKNKTRVLEVSCPLGISKNTQSLKSHAPEG